MAASDAARPVLPLRARTMSAAAADPVFDHVIVGGGSAGCVLAARLSADPARRVLLLEAGEDTRPGEVPAAIASPAPIAIFAGTRFLWPLLRVLPFPQRRPGHARFYEQARVMGGGSSVNAQVGNRGIPADYDEWAALGAEGWDWQGVLPFFRRLETDADHAGPLHGSDGPLPVQRVGRAQWPGFSHALSAALDRAGLPDIGDQNGAFADGHFAAAYTNFDVATPDARRASAAMVYLTEAVRARPNLAILDAAHVTALLMDGTRATGVAYARHGTQHRARAAEVILAAGALHSPAMLMRAGIGPADELARHGIAPRLVLEGVGRNLRDHPGTHLCAWVPPAQRNRPGMRKSGHIAARFSSGLAGAPASDLYMHNGVSSGWHGVGRRVAYFYLWVNKPASVGRVTLRSTDPQDHPRVEMNLLGEATDTARLAEGVRRIAGVMRTMQRDGALADPFAVRFSPLIRFMAQLRAPNRWVMGALGRLLDGPAWLRRLLVRFVLSNAPPLDRLLADPVLLEDYLRHNAMSVSHVSCTCRMGRADDPMAVADSQGRVHGAQGLRVADASLMPTLPRANTNLATIMIAEKLADAILAAHPATPPLALQEQP